MLKKNRRSVRKSVNFNAAYRPELLEPRRMLSSQIFVVNNGAQVIQEYSTTGATINGSLITNVVDPNGMAISGSDIFEANYVSGTIGEYTTSGATVNAALVSGLNDPTGIAVSGSNLFVTNSGAGTVGEYTTSGAVVNAAFISGLIEPSGISVSGSNLYVAGGGDGTINEYTTSGTVVNAPLVSGINEPDGLTVSGADLFVTSFADGSVEEYDGTSGAAINPSLVTGLSQPFGVAVSGADLFVTTNTGVGEYTTSGAAVNASLITGVTEMLGIAIVNTTPPPPAGSPDVTFNNGNPVNLNFDAQASAVTSTGQILLAGLEPTSSGGSKALLEQLNSDGSIDNTFGASGIVTDAATNDEAFYGVVTESDGTIVAAGTSDGDFLLAGYNSDGSVDKSFGTDGRDIVPITGTTDATAFGITTDASGNIVVVGSAGGQFLADRFTPGGLKDTTFNGGAALLFGSASDGDVLGKVAVASNGDIIAAGASSGSVVVTRLTPPGALDSTFGTGGIVTVSQLTAPDLLGQPDFTEGLTIDSESRILVANTNTAGDFAVARITSSGFFDSTFGTAGVVTTNLGGTADADFVAVQPDGSQILVAGTNTTNGVVDSVIAAYTPSGVPDTTFGNSGTEILPDGTGATPTALLSSSPLVIPEAEGIGAIIQQVYGSLSNGKLIVGKSMKGSASGSGVLQRFNAAPPTDTPLSLGTLAETLTVRLPLASIGGTRTNTIVSVTVKNPGRQLISGFVPVTLYFSLGQSLGDATELVTASPRLRLKAAAHTVVRLRIPTIPSLPMGSYYLIAVVDAPDGSSTGIAGQTIVITPPFVSVVLSSVTPPTAPVIPGRVTSLVLALQNQGNVLANGLASVAIIASVDAIAADGQPLATVPLRIRLRPAQLGRYRLRLRVPKTFAAGSYYLAVSVNLSALTDIVVPGISAVSTSTLNVT